MSTPNDGGPAFPWREEDGAGGYNQHVGMSLRDWFAGQVLCGLHANTTINRDVSDMEVAAACYTLADAMLAERAKGGAS